jgi:uncharacterized protein YoxC
VWLGVLAVVSVLEALAVVGLSVGGILVYRRVTTILEDVQKVTSTVTTQAERLTGFLRCLAR